MAADPGLLGAAADQVTGQGHSPERAVWTAVGEIAAALNEQGGLLAERVPDLHDVRNCIVSELLGRPAPGLPDRVEPYVLVARDLAPADTALIDPTVCRGIVTVDGGPTSRTAILVRSLGLPAVVAARDAMDLPEGSMVIIDGSTGEIVMDPTDDQVLRAEERISRVLTFDGQGQTRDGHCVQLLANVASPDSVAAAIEAKAEGVGLFRTEFCFLDHAEALGLDEQVAAYRRVFAAFPGKKATIRTLDAGADKPLTFVTAADEINPAAATTAGPILDRVDFASLGTNDLAQYTMAADRLMGELALLNDPWQPAVLRMIREACRAGAASGKPVGVCGEAAADPLLAAILVGLGATSLSMSPQALGGVAEFLGGVTAAQCGATAIAVVAAADAAADAAGAAAAAAAARAAATALLVPART